MSPSWMSRSRGQADQVDGPLKASEKRSCLSRQSKTFWMLLVAGIFLLIIAIGLGIGLGIGLTRGSSGGNSGNGGGGSGTPSSPNSTTNATAGEYWKPAAGTSWQIVLENPPTDTSLNVAVYDIDLFDNTASTISKLHANGRKVICYFSAGSYEPNRADSAQFKKSDYGKGLDGWPGEYWLNTNSANVRAIMSARLALAHSKGCDGVDPDNVDGYDNDSGLSLSPSTAEDYLRFLAIGAHSYSMSIGLKNAGAIVNATLDFLQWEVNEQCVQYEECDLFRPFIAAGKPVFHIEYPGSAPSISASARKSACDNNEAHGFSTVMKEMDLNDWVEDC
ncbi:hypothetical protein LHYA1_G002452 [Lachnellula hyalina]|uniref:alpha-galactosidase n=1 Tax=Lachnellula hyalina TaxID=1316788 RepID=A0A8H8U2M0_9HELO|nr:uncharacterized protein LHYA1_G002452 [Lachnellula hyalina]TVY29122.1 hypothetical protein LHYA1_G002452 [Lachnellula hyalina]